MKYLIDAIEGLLALEKELAALHGCSDCCCIGVSYELEQAYENGRCPHQIARVALKTAKMLDMQAKPHPPISPQRWKVGMKVMYRHHSEYAFTKGGIGVIHKLLEDKQPGSAYQVFWTNPIRDNGKPDKHHSCWTTPANVDYIEYPCPKCSHPLKEEPGGGTSCTKCDYWFCY